MADNKKLEAGLRAIAADFHLPGGGRKKLARLVTEHLWWFSAAEQRGMGWQDVVRALAAAGIAAESGKPFSVGTLSSTVWRKRAEAEAGLAIKAPRRRARRAPPHAILAHGTPPQGAKPTETKRPRWETEPRKVAERPQAIRPRMIPSKGNPAQNDDILAFMGRARAVRRRSE